MEEWQERVGEWQSWDEGNHSPESINTETRGGNTPKTKATLPTTPGLVAGLNDDRLSISFRQEMSSGRVVDADFQVACNPDCRQLSARQSQVRSAPITCSRAR